jgi:hypothetical protein
MKLSREAVARMKLFLRGIYRTIFDVTALRRPVTMRARYDCRL